MRFVSTRGGVPPADLRSAILAGPAPDGGLYVPERLPPLPGAGLEELRGLGFPALAFRILRHVLEESLPDDVLEGVVERALDFPIPLVAPEDGAGEPSVWIGELFHGPTGAFKDVGARFLAQLTSALRRSPDEGMITLVATSGDTGGAVARAFGDIPGCRAVVAYPRGRISPVQENQIRTAGPGVRPIEVDGSFDDCQRLVRAVLDEASRGTTGGVAGRAGASDPIGGVPFVSGNSINVGRLLPQLLYYAHLYLSMPQDLGTPVFAVPTGNLGNLTAGLMARRIGVPVRGLVGATNRNDTLVRFLEEGTVDARRASVPTLSSAMDVAVPSNLERALHLFDGDRSAFGEVVRATTHGDRETLEIMARVHGRTGYALDPHTAVGLLGLLESRRAGGFPGRSDHGGSPAAAIVLATAHPAKFPETTFRATGSVPEAPVEWVGSGSPVRVHPAPADLPTFREIVLSIAAEVG